MAALNNTRFTLMALPQSVDADGILSLNIIWVPRNISPLEPVNTIYGDANLAPAFADIQPQFDVHVVNDASEFAGKIPANDRAESALLVFSDQVRKIYETLKSASNADGTLKYFDIDESRSSDVSTLHSAPDAEAPELSVKKYLPVSYRQAFNFTSPRHKNAVTDDSYHCAIRDTEPPQNLVKETKVSWGKVYAFLLRQPLMAQKAGLIFHTTVKLKQDDFNKPGWIYVDISPGSTYSAEETKALTLNDFFIKRYAARIPVLKRDAEGNFEARNLFSAVLFPVMASGQNPDGNFDELFIEAARYNDGFSKIVHASQPVSGNLLKEEQDGFHPQKEAGIRLGWDDEQILIWYLRQMAKNETVTDPGGRLDAPLGVAGYHIDVKKDEEAALWQSLNEVESNGEMFLEDINIGSFQGELPYQVYPVKLYGNNSNNYWLPMYFSNWNDASLAIPDKTAAELYQNSKSVQKKPDGTVEDRQVHLSDTYSAPKLTTRLRYGNSYLFRVRLADLSGGGPGISGSAVSAGPEHIGKAGFKRYIAPATLRLNENPEVKHSTDELNFTGNQLIFKRPVLGYPAVVYTNKYDDAVALLKAQSQEQLALIEAGQPVGYSIGLADPDVTQIEIKVEVETLQMDNLLSDSGRENYITLYTTYRDFDPGSFESELTLAFSYKDFPVLNLSDKVKPFDNDADNDSINALAGEIVLPTARNLRITFRAVCNEQANYWGHINSNHDLDSRYGKTTVLKMRRPSITENNLFSGTEDPQVLQAIFLQPDPLPVYNSDMKMQMGLPFQQGIPDIVQRLGKQLDVQVQGLSLTAQNGQRVQFWCSNLIRHTLSPDNSSITFSSRDELTDLWLVVTSLLINRDWTWDALKPSSFSLLRKRRFGRSPDNLELLPFQFIGDLELRRTVPYQAIQEGEDGLIHRESTRIIFIDALDPHTANNNFPDTLQVQYQLISHFREDNPTVAPATFETAALQLPATVNPKQLPKVIGAGIALSPYVRNKQYSFTEARKRFLWLEFEHSPEDVNDELFCRPLAYAPDQLLSNNHPSLFETPKESPLPVDPEFIRVITPVTAHDHPGLKAMQKLEKSIDTDRHFYLLPLPPSLHQESPELFGFYTFEFRFGHSDRLWSTAQGRFGRSFRLTGIQYPAPTLTCNVTRDEKKIIVNAAFAQSVFKGRNVTANPPRTTLWALLYAQVKQADGLDFRNILIDERRLRQPPAEIKYRTQYERIMKDPDLTVGEKHLAYSQVAQLNLSLQREAKTYAEATWANPEIAARLNMYGLPLDSSLSIICVEFYGMINNVFEHISDLPEVRDELINNMAIHFDKKTAMEMDHSLPRGIGFERVYQGFLAQKEKLVDAQQPLSMDLGKHRILRTSPLTEVPFVCCTENE